MSSLSRELVFLILQFLDEEKFKDTIHWLEKESGFYFNLRYFEDLVTNGEWDEVEKYLVGFTKVDDNRYSMKTFFEIRKQKYLEALDRREHPKAVEILVKDLKVFSAFNEDLFKEITMLLTLTNFRENEQLSKYGDTKSSRATMLVELKKLIEANPLFRDKLQFPSFKNSRLRTLINQSLNWQHQLCKNQRPNPDIKTLFMDHSCGQPNGAARALSPSPITNPLLGSMPKVGTFPPLGAQGPFQPMPHGFSTPPLAGWMANPSSVPHQTVAVGTSHHMSLGAPSSGGVMPKRPRTTTDSPTVENQSLDSDLMSKRARQSSVGDEGHNVPVNILPITFPSPSQTPTLNLPEELPKIIVANLSQGSDVKSMAFHPSQHSLLLVGTNLGDVSLWEVSKKERVMHKNFKVWELSQCSVTLQASLAREYTASVNRVAWSPDGTMSGVAYSKHIVHVYTYRGGFELENHLEIDAHSGYVSDLAFAHPNKKLSIITCGEDKTIKVWDANNGSKLFTFEGHEAPVYSVCPHYKESVQFVLSTSVDGKINAWLYDHGGSRANYDAPGRSCIKMAYTTDGKRLFSCGTNKDGESFIVEWNESEGTVKRSYLGLGKSSVGVVEFDTTCNKYLAVGDDFSIKFWDMENVNLLTTTDADGALPASPCIRFNKDGTLLAVSTRDNGIKVLANAEGRLDSFRAPSSSLLKGPQTTIFSTSSPMAAINIGAGERNMPSSSIIALNGNDQSTTDVKPNIEKYKVWRLTEINDPSQLRSLRLADHTLPVRIMRLLYTNSGGAILALAYNATHKLWRWQRNDRNVSGKATSAVAPQLWTPPSGVLMTNEIRSANPEDVVPCFSLSKNDSYVMSASGGKISLFNMMTFKTMTTFMSPPPAATSLAFHPEDNNIIAIGMDDSTIHIFNIRVDEVTMKLKGHKKRVTGLAFSNVLNVLISSGSDAQLCAWSIDGWEKQANKFLEIPTGRTASPNAQTRVRFHQDQVHMLVVHETQVAVYEASNLECKKQWFPRESNSGITYATYSCDSETVFVTSNDGSVAILVASTLALRCKINQSAYLPTNPRVFPVAIAAHPSEPNQLAIGLSDGYVQVIEPIESDAKWGTPLSSENGVGPGVSSAIVASDQPSRFSAGMPKDEAC